MMQSLPSGKQKNSSRVWASIHLCMPAASGVGQLVLHKGHTHAKTCNHGGLCQQMNEKSILQIICTYRWSSYLGHVSHVLGKIENILSNYWVSNRIKY